MHPFVLQISLFLRKWVSWFSASLKDAHQEPIKGMFQYAVPKESTVNTGGLHNHWCCCWITSCLIFNILNTQGERDGADIFILSDNTAKALQQNLFPSKQTWYLLYCLSYCLSRNSVKITFYSKSKESLWPILNVYVQNRQFLQNMYGDIFNLEQNAFSSRHHSHFKRICGYSSYI